MIYNTKEMFIVKNLFETVKLKNLTMKNRLIRSATWEGIAEPDGSITDESYEIYRELSKGGVGAIITGFTSVSSNDFYFGGMMRLSDDKLIPQYKKLTDIIHAENCPVISQLALGGYYKGHEIIEPDEMTQTEIQDVIKLFVNAAVRAKKANFDGVQIHAAHFFFLSRFISPRFNHSKDRAKILFEILDGIKNKVPDIHITIKINSSDFTFGGLDENESLEICKKLSEAGIDSIEVSGNGTSVAGIKPHVNEAYFLNFASKLADEISPKTPVILVGGLRSLATMQGILNDTKIELLSLSRPLLREPDFPKLLQSGKLTESKCISCNACYSSKSHRCIFRG